MAQIGEPRRIITVEPLYEPLPGRETPHVEPAEIPAVLEPEQEPVHTGN
jgi:hypothetical protein